MKVNFDELRQIQDLNNRSKRIAAIIDQCIAEKDTVFLSDCIVNHEDVGGDVLFELAQQEKEALMSGVTPMTWKILVVRDEWGNKPRIGDKIVKINKKPLKKRDGKLYSSDELNVAKLDGSYQEKFETRVEYHIDAKGCISCTFQDAVHFLHTWGIHAKTGRTMTTKKEHSSEPAMCPDGQMRHVWYWRYKEMDREDYAKLLYLDPEKNIQEQIEKLPSLNPNVIIGEQQEEEPKRGYKK